MPSLVSFSNGFDLDFIHFFAAFKIEQEYIRINQLYVPCSLSVSYKTHVYRYIYILFVILFLNE